MGVEDNKNNPFSKEYESGAWWDLDDNTVPENNSGYGNLLRGLVEFGLLSTVTGGIGGKIAATTGLAKAGTRLGTALYKGSRAAGIGKFGSRTINYVSKLPTVAAQGTIADAIMQSSETANIMNLVNEHAPFIPFAEALAVDPEKDTVWISRMKSVAAGAGMNVLGHFLGGFVRSTYKAHKAVRKGMPIDEANAKFTQEQKKAHDVSTAKDIIAAGEMRALSKADKRGMLGRDFRLEYNEKHLEDYDFEQYTLLRKGEMPDEVYMRAMEDKHPTLDFGTYGLFSGSGRYRYMTFINTGEAATLIYVVDSSNNSLNGWRIINTGAKVGDTIASLLTHVIGDYSESLHTSRLAELLDKGGKVIVLDRIVH